MQERNLYFKSSRDDVKLIAENVTYEEAFGCIANVLEDKGISPPYYRMWGENPIWIDFGSHTQFFAWGDLQ